MMIIMLLINDHADAAAASDNDDDARQHFFICLMKAYLSRSFPQRTILLSSSTFATWTAFELVFNILQKSLYLATVFINVSIFTVLFSPKF